LGKTGFADVTIVHISVTVLSPLGNICVIYLTFGVWPVPVTQAVGRDGIPSNGRPGSNRSCALWVSGLLFLDKTSLVWYT
jgi:hypothetical protein